MLTSYVGRGRRKRGGRGRGFKMKVKTRINGDNTMRHVA